MVIITHTRRARHGVVLTGKKLAAPEPASARPTDRGRRESESLIGHLAALGGETARHVAAHATNARAAIEPPSPLPARAWGGTGRTEGFRFRAGGRGI